MDAKPTEMDIEKWTRAHALGMNEGAKRVKNAYREGLLLDLIAEGAQERMLELGRENMTYLDMFSCGKWGSSKQGADWPRVKLRGIFRPPGQESLDCEMVAEFGSKTRFGDVVEIAALKMMGWDRYVESRVDRLCASLAKQEADMCFAKDTKPASPLMARVERCELARSVGAEREGHQEKHRSRSL